MKGKKRLRHAASALAAAVLLIALTVGGCSAKSMDSQGFPGAYTGENSSYRNETVAETAAASENMDSSGTSLTSETDVLASTPKNQRKLIKNVDLSVETKEFDSLITSLSAKIEELGGYVENSDISGSSYQYQNTRYGYMTARIPQDRLDEFVTCVSSLGNVTRRHDSVQDVTLQYVDTESKIKSLKAEQESLITMLEKAENLEDIIKIQSRMTEVRYQLESNESQLRTYDNLVTYSTVTMDITEVKQITEPAPTGTFDEIRQRLEGNLADIAGGFLDFFIWLVSSLPYLLIWAAVILGIVLLVRRLWKKHTPKKKGPNPPAAENKQDTLQE